ncbi:MAG: hypothetical protein V2B14_06465 [bacterium]
MKTAEKNRQKLSSSQTRAANAKYNFGRWKINLTTLEDYLQYMAEDNLKYETS